MPLTIANAIAITPAVETSRKKEFRKRIEGKVEMGKNDETRLQMVKWKIEDTEKRIDHKMICKAEKLAITDSNEIMLERGRRRGNIATLRI